jgi:hypothetical protein
MYDEALTPAKREKRGLSRSPLYIEAYRGLYHHAPTSPQPLRASPRRSKPSAIPSPTPDLPLKRPQPYPGPSHRAHLQWSLEASNESITLEDLTRSPSPIPSLPSSSPLPTAQEYLFGPGSSRHRPIHLDLDSEGSDITGVNHPIYVSVVAWMEVRQ